MSNRDIVRILDEQKESTRRRMVLEGKWSEAESEDRMKQAVREAANE